MRQRDPKGSAPAARRARKLTKKTALFASGSVLALGVLGGGVAFATGTIPGPSGVINACYQNAGPGPGPGPGHGPGHGPLGGPGGPNQAGALRVVPSGTACGPNETALSWNQTGPQGPQGKTGATGAQGPQGATGNTGPQGATGAQGAAGAQGPQGATGPQGAAGAQGPQGATGPQGPQGAAAGQIVTQQGVEEFGTKTADEVTLTCPSGSRAISGSDVPSGLSYNGNDAASGVYRTEWSGAANNDQWDWYFENVSTSNSITMVFTVFCQQG